MWPFLIIFGLLQTPALPTFAPAGDWAGDARVETAREISPIEAGMAVEFHLQGRNLQVELIRPDGTVSQTWEKGDYTCESELIMELAAVTDLSGGWRIRLEALDPSAPAPFRLEWTRLAPAEARDRQIEAFQRALAGVDRALLDPGVDISEHARPVRSQLRDLNLSPLGESRWIEHLADRLWEADWEMAAELFKESLDERRKQLGEAHLCVADSAEALGVLLKEHGKWEPALGYHLQSLQIRERQLAAGHPDIGATLYNLGVLTEALARFEESMGYFERALPIFRASPRLQSQVPTVLYSLGEVCRSLNRYPEAESHFRAALRLARERMEENDPVVGRILSSLGGFHRDRGELMQAEEWTREALQLKQIAADDLRSLANGHLNLGEILRLQARYPEAESHYLRSLELAREWFPPDSPELAWYLNQAAKFFLESGQSAARDLFTETLEVLSSNPDHPLYAQTLHDMAVEGITPDLEERESRLRQAVEIRSRSLGLPHPDTAFSRVRLAEILLAKGDLEQSRQEVSAARRAFGQSGVHPLAEVDALVVEAQLQRHDGNQEAYTVLQEALDLLEDLRVVRGGGHQSRAALWQSHLDSFHQMVGWRLEDDQPEEAWTAIEKYRARVFLDQVSASGVDLLSTLPDDQRAALAESRAAARGRIASVQEQIRIRAAEPETPRTLWRQLGEELRQSIWDFNRIEERIRQASPLWRDRIATAVEPVPLEQWRAQLGKAGEAALIFQIGSRHSLLLLVGAADAPIHAHRLKLTPAQARVLRTDAGELTSEKLSWILQGGGPESLLAQLGDVHNAIAEIEQWPGYDSGELMRQLNALWEVLVPGEVWTRLAGWEQVVLLPDSGLYQLPFEALVVRSGENSATSRFWLDEGPAIRYASSATLQQALLKRRDAVPRSGRLLSVSNPDYSAGEEQDATSSRSVRFVPGGLRLQQLPGTTLETQAIVAQFGAERVTVLSGKEASEKRVRAELAGKKYLHLATHGLLSAEQPELSALAFAPGTDASEGDDDGFLQLFEIYTLPLTSDLAVLSACDTNRGELVAGEGLFALSRAFLVAGAARVTASQWPVDDRATAALIGGFFALIHDSERSGDVDYVRALQQAKRQARAKSEWSHPYFWAPFVMMGLG